MNLPLWLGGAVAVAGGVGVLVARTPVHNVIALILNFIGLAVLYLTIDAEFLAVVQIIVYAGAIMVLFLFVIALLTTRLDPAESDDSGPSGQTFFGILTGTALVMLLVGALAGFEVPAASDVDSGFGQVAEFGKSLFTTHVFPFELAGLVLMVALVGVVILIGRKQS